MLSSNILKMSFVFPQPNRLQLGMNYRSVVEIILFIILGWEERIQVYKKKEETFRLTNTSFTRETVMRKIIKKTRVYYKTSDCGILELQNLHDRLSWGLSSNTESVIALL